MTENPFAAPLTVGTTPADLSPPIAKDGVSLVVVSGVELPKYCVKTGQPVEPQDMQHKTLFWCPPWVILLLFAGVLFVVIGYFLCRKKCDLVYGLHPDVRRKYRRRFWLKAAIALVVFCAIPLMAGFKSAAPMVIVLILFLIAIVALVAGNAPLTIRKHKKGRFWIRGFSPDFLARLES